MATSTEHELIAQTALDYFEGWFDGDTARMERALHPELAKRRPAASTGTSASRRRRGCSSSPARATARRTDGDRRLDVEVQDVYGDIASVTRPLGASTTSTCTSCGRASGWQIANALWRPT